MDIIEKLIAEMMVLHYYRYIIVAVFISSSNFKLIILPEPPLV